MPTHKFSDWKRAVFRCGKEIKGLRGGVHRYAAQVSLQIDAATAEKNHFWMKTIMNQCKVKTIPATLQGCRNTRNLSTYLSLLNLLPRCDRFLR